MERSRENGGHCVAGRASPAPTATTAHSPTVSGPHRPAGYLQAGTSEAEVPLLADSNHPATGHHREQAGPGDGKDLRHPRCHQVVCRTAFLRLWHIL